MGLELISADNLFTKSGIQAKGIYLPSVFLYNLDDWKAATLAESSDEITSITNDTGKEAFEISTDKPANIVPQVTQRVVSGGIDGFNHQISFPAVNVGGTERADLEKLLYGKFVAIVFLKQGIGVAYGTNVGMRATEWNDQAGEAAVGGLITITLATPDDEPPEIDSGRVINAGTFASTQTLIDTTIVTVGA